MKKIVDQFQIEHSENTLGKNSTTSAPVVSEEIATLAYILNTFAQHVIDIPHHPLRTVQKKFDEIAKALMSSSMDGHENTLFQARQFISSYRIEEYTFVLKTFEDFKNIIWDFADQLAEDIKEEKTADQTLKESFEKLKDAYESNSVETLKKKSREFINSYAQIQGRKQAHSEQKMGRFRKNLKKVQKQLLEAHHNLHVDHLTQAHNRASFEEQAKKCLQLLQLSEIPSSLILLDIDHFKKVNDTYGHDVGDYVLKECVRLLKEVFIGDNDFVSRIGGEEFAVILPQQDLASAQQKAEKALEHIRSQVFIHQQHQIRFTVSMGLALLSPNENVGQWLKRSDEALYQSKNNGRNRLTLAKNSTPHLNAA